MASPRAAVPATGGFAWDLEPMEIVLRGVDPAHSLNEPAAIAGRSVAWGLSYNFNIINVIWIYRIFNINLAAD
jgi:hypothetical protein